MLRNPKLISPVDISVWSVGESFLKPHNGITQKHGLVLLLHFLEAARLHLVLKEIHEFNLELTVEFSLLENIKLSNNLIQGVNLESLLDFLFATVGEGSKSGQTDVFEHFFLLL